MLLIRRNTFTTKEQDEPKIENQVIITANGRMLYKICTLVIGTLVLPTASTGNISIPTLWKKIKLKISEQEAINSFFSFDEEQTEYEFCFICDTHFTKDLVESKIFDYQIYIVDSEVNMALYINPGSIESKTSSRDRHVIRSLMYRVFEITDQSVDGELIQSSRDINLNELFDKVICSRVSTNDADSSDDYARCLKLHTQMHKKLYPYQERAIGWMVKREQSKASLQPPRLYQPVLLHSDFTIFYNPYQNRLTAQTESIPTLGSGGLLCDEMGLGKTVEVLGCILLHKRRKSKSSGTNNRRRIESDTSDDEDDEDEEIPLADRAKALRARPTIKRLRRACIPRNKESNSIDLATVQPTRSRIPDKFKRPEKSAMLQMLQDWYNGKLSDYDESKRMANTNRQREIEISCTCGISTDDSSTNYKLVKCSECEIYQHAACFGYKTKVTTTAGYLCAACWKLQPLLKSGATLIVCPSRLLSQWQDEIRKHVRGELRVLIYEGGSRSRPVYPTELLRYDVVLTTYSALQTDLVLTESSGKSLRQKSRYCAPAAPIANINWWRLVLDEAQLVESPTVSVSKMAKLLSAKHRWAITGTPITKGLEDLLGIIDYLNMEPYSNPDIWYFKLLRPYLTDDEAPMLNFLAEVMWRTEKRHIKEQINIPKQSFEVIWLDFSQIESYFYSREYEASKKLFTQKLDALKMPEQTPIHTLPVQILSNILLPVLTLRHACSHFSAVKGRYLVTRKPLNSLQDLLGALVHKNSVDFEDNLRITISAWNGMAGIHLLLNNPGQAVQQYKRILALKENLREPTSSMKVEIDKLQVIHSLHNLILILEGNPKLRLDGENIDQLKEEHLRYEKLYIDKFDVEVLKAKKDFDEAGSSISKIAEEYDLDKIWDIYASVDWIVENRLYGRLVSMLKGHPQMTTDNRCIDRLNIGMHKELMSMLDQWETKLTNARDVCVTAVVDLADCSNKDDVRIDTITVEAAVQCHLRTTSLTAVANGERPKCLVCKTDIQLNDYEALLYNKQWKASTSTISKQTSRGSWAPSSEEIALQCIARLALKQPDCAEAKRRGKAQKQLLDGMRKELKAARALWMKISFAVNSRDELNNCKMRLEINHDVEGEDYNRRNRINPSLRQIIDKDDDRLERINFLNPNELDYQHARLNNEAESAVLEYERLLGTNLYLSTLRGENARAGGEGHALDPCPICRSELGATFHMMPCGHCYCVNCTHALVQDAVRNMVPCAVCRLRHNLKDINYLKIKEEAQEPISKDSIKGNCSTKLEAAIRLILRLREEEPTVKVLIYSIWETVLKILLEALKENGVLAVRMANDQQLDKFKDPTKNITALLLRISSGSKGLTLIEATHVILLDPVLDPSDELQAISRVHRIGQTRPTVVHRFLMRDSIDSSIYNITNKNAEKSIGWKDITIAQLKELFTHT